MKTQLKIIILMLSVVLSAYRMSAQGRNVSVTTNGVLTAPLTFFVANSNLLNQAIPPSGLSSAVISLNGLNGSNQTFSVGSTGTDVAIVSSGTNHAFNLPTQDGGAIRGLLSSNDWSRFNATQIGGVGAVVVQDGNYLGVNSTLTNRFLRARGSLNAPSFDQLFSADIPSLDASKITTGTIAAARLSLSSNDIPQLPASKIDSGTFSTNRLPVGTAGYVLTGNGTNPPSYQAASGGGASDTWTNSGSAVLQNTDQTNNLALLNYGTGNVIFSTYPDGSPTQSYPWDIAGLFNDVLIGPTFLPASAAVQDAVLIGYNSGLSAVSGQSFVAIGFGVVPSGTNVYRTVAIGENAGSGIKKDSQGIYIGEATGPAFGSVSSNSIFIGYQAGASNSVNSAIAIGDGANASYSSSTAIGKGAVATRTNQVQLGTVNDQVNVPGSLTVNGASVLTNTPAGLQTGSANLTNWSSLSTNAVLKTTGNQVAGNYAKWSDTNTLGNSLLSSDTTNLWYSGAGAFGAPIGTTAQRPPNATNGFMRYNTDTSRQEFYTGSAWRNHVRLDGDTMTGPLTDTNAVLVTPTISGATLSGNTTNSAATASRFATWDANKVLSSSGASADLAATLSDESGTGAALFSSGNTQTNATLVTPTISGASLSGTTTNTSTFSGTFTNTGTIGVSGVATFGSTLTASSIIQGSALVANASGPRITLVNGGTTYVKLGASADGLLTLYNGNESSFTRLTIGPATAAFPALARTLAGLTLMGGDGVAASTNSLIVPGTVTATNGFASLDTTAAVNIAATGYTNLFGKDIWVAFDGTAMTWTEYNNAGTALYTNAVAMTGSTHVPLQASGKIIITGTSVTGRAFPR